MGSEEKCNQLRLITSSVHVQGTNFEGDRDRKGQAFKLAVGNGQIYTKKKKEKEKPLNSHQQGQKTCHNRHIMNSFVSRKK